MSSAVLTPPHGAANPAGAPGSAKLLASQTTFMDRALVALASLRLTVALFALTIFLVFAGTLAQVDHDIWFVVEQSYFRVWFAWVEFQAFARLVEMFTKAEPQPVAGGFWFPGGLLIGSVMFANLLAAHAIRFKVAAKGSRLTWGLAVLATGVAATVGVIATGMDQSLKGQLSSDFCSGLWQAVRAALAGFSLWSAYWCATRWGKIRPPEWWLATVLAAGLVILSVWLYANPSVAPDDAGMRIVWELTKCTGAAVLTFAGCWMVFRQRAGIVLLHTGIGLLMVGELVTHLTAVEGQMSIPEGGTATFAQDIRTTELSITTNEGESDRVTVIPQGILARAAQSGESIQHADLPFDVRVVRFDKNSRLAQPSASVSNPATKGAGLLRVAIDAKSVSGVAVDDGVNRPSAYVEPLDKQSGESLGVWLVSASFEPMENGGGSGLLPQPIEVDGETYEIDLRFKHLYKPYSITLTDFRFDRYAGTQRPKNFQSDIILRDPARGVDRPVKIWMNNPLRYAGDTLYQSDYDKATEKITYLQVVTNSGWMIPYLSCMFVGLGMLSHFIITLARFVRRRNEEAARNSKADPTAAPRTERLAASTWRRPSIWAPALAAVVAVGYLGGKARVPRDEPGRMPTGAFGELPVLDGGRVKPLDTLARTTLQAISGLQEVKPIDDDSSPTPAIDWMLDVISGREGWREHRVFRIENLEVLDALDLKARPGSFRYSHAEVFAEEERAQELISQTIKRNVELRDAENSDAEVEPLTVVEKQATKLLEQLQLVIRLREPFGSPPLSGDPTTLRQEFMAAAGEAQRLDATGAARVITPEDADGQWRTLYSATLTNLLASVTNQKPNPAATAWNEALSAYSEGESGRFADALADLRSAASKYEGALNRAPAAAASLARSERLSSGKLRFERFFNAFSPFYYSAATYVLAFVLIAASWLGLGGRTASIALGRAAMAVILVTLVVHTFALVGRIYISGRPPVTNLYSSAVFIGWAGVLFGVAFEAVHRLGIGSAVASLLGFATLVVAHYLSLDGDTFTVLQAVLDTQFWLATHVVCITLGYATTYLAGLLGVAYLFAVAVPGFVGARSALDSRQAKQVTTMIYGTLCFALLFSFVGTVLGGLWADDSWGRFWGWDPKENGALIIVLWNALVLHARWGKMVGPLGLATLAVGGNIVTTWSWFGVNELGVGLHAYGASDSSTALWLLGFAASQAAIIVMGCAAPKAKTA